MLDIEYKGGNAVAIATKKTKVVIDPNMSSVGLGVLPAKGMVELVTEPRYASGSSESLLFIDGPGEYEVGDVSIRGISAQRFIDDSSVPHESTLYRIEANGLHIALLGNVSESLTEDQLEALGVVDLLIIPVGGGYTLDPVAASNLTRRIDPKAVVPVHYADSGLTYEMPQAELSEFKDELGAPVETLAKYKLKSAGSLPQVLTIVEVTRS